MIPKIISWGTKYGKNRLFPASPLPEGIILLCEGEPDTICAISNGLNAITQTGKTKKWSKNQLKKFKGREVVIAFDADQPGQMHAKNAALEISKVATAVYLLEWPNYMGRRDDGQWPENHGQDLTDFFVKYKKSVDDLQRLIDNAKRFEPPEPDLLGQPLEFFSPGVNGRMSFKPRSLAAKILETNKFLYVPETGLFYRYENGYFKRFQEDNLNTMAIKLLGAESKQARVRDAVFQVMALSIIPPARSLNDMTDWLCIKNCMINIRTLETKNHDPDFYASYQLGVTYNPNSKNKCDRWLQLLDENIQTRPVIAQIQEYFGYCLYRGTPFAKCLLFICPGGGGKSTMLKILTEMVGSENCASITFNEMEDQFLRSTLYQKSVNVCGEVGSKIIESTYFKAVTSGDRINAAFKHKNAFTFEPFCKVIFSGNKMPRVKDTSDGLYRRLLPIKFKRQFLEGDPDTDPFLEQKLLTELSEIFLWALTGLNRLMKNKQFTNCDETINLMMDYKRLNNPVLCFAQDVCSFEESARSSKKDVFKRYENYCRNYGYRAYSYQNFFKELYAAFASLKTFRPRKDNPKRNPYVKGIRLTGEMS